MPRSTSRSRTPSKRLAQALIASPASETRKSKKDSTVTCSASDVLIFYPNLIGYARVLFMIASFYYAASDWKKCFFCYGCAFFGDVVDGWVARRFNQSSVYGGILDMVTDRVSTAGFLCMLSTLYTKYAFYFSMLLVLDIASHWFHVASVALLTVGQGTFK
jgi:CDP-diacylglycerol--inositol 3-phosphatidyltransferase